MYSEVRLRSTDGATTTFTATSNASMNADLPLIDVAAKLLDVDRQIGGYSRLSTDAAHALAEGLDAVDSAYVTLTSSHLDQLRLACQLPPGYGHDVIRSVLKWLGLITYDYGYMLILRSVWAAKYPLTAHAYLYNPRSPLRSRSLDFRPSPLRFRLSSHTLLSYNSVFCGNSSGNLEPSHIATCFRHGTSLVASIFISLRSIVSSLLH